MDFEKEIKALKKRNEKVELDKAWETSNFRLAAIAIITYLISLAVMYVLGIKKPFFGAVIPTLGFAISMQSLPFIKDFWIKKFYKK